jgi:hypothetical protein
MAGVGAGATAAASIYGAKKQSDTSAKVAAQQITAANDAAKVEADAAAEQLKFLREQDAKDRAQAEVLRKQSYDTSEASRLMDYNQWAHKQTGLAPYQGAGQASVGSLANLMGLKPENMAVAAPKAAVPYAPIPYTPMDTSTSIPATLGSTANAGTVRMRAPDGSVKAVPAASVQHYEQLGAVRL